MKTGLCFGLFSGEAAKEAKRGSGEHPTRLAGGAGSSASQHLRLFLLGVQFTFGTTNHGPSLS
jgi:hypothetical protein